jgi:adenine-specific DNA-methyltransferase
MEMQILVTTLVDKILEAKRQDKNTAVLESKIDQLIYKLYNLNPEEQKIVERP